MSRGRSVLLGTAKPNWKSAGPPGVPVVVDSELDETITVISSVAGDERAALGHQAQIERERVRAQARDALARNEIACDDQRLDQVVSDVLAVRQGYATAFEELLTAGRRLNSIQFTVGAGGYKALFKAALFPFSEPTASKMRRIAHLWDKAIIPSDLLPLLPQNLSGAYLIASLPEDTIVDMVRSLAQRQILPSASVKTLEREVKALRGPAKDDTPLSRLETSLAEKRAARDLLDTEIRELEAKISAEREASKIETTA